MGRPAAIIRGLSFGAVAGGVVGALVGSRFRQGRGPGILVTRRVSVDVAPDITGGVTLSGSIAF